MILAIYLTGLVVTFFFDLTLDLSCADTKFNIIWILEMITSFLLWPVTVIFNLVMVLYLRSKGKYTFKKDGHK